VRLLIFRRRDHAFLILDRGVAYAKLDRPYERCPWIDELNTEFSAYLPDRRSNLPF